jgi:hypothetical protein
MDIKFTTNDPAVLEHFPVKPANKVVPEWYRDIGMWHKNIGRGLNLPTIKHCMPVQDMITSGYIIFNTYETVIQPSKSGGYLEYKANCPNKDYISSHHHEQCPVQLDGQAKSYFKINQPWIVRTPPGYSCLIVQPFYQFEERYQMLPSIVDTDVHDLEVAFPGYSLTDKEFKLEIGHPLMQIIPFKRDEWKMTCEAVPLKRSLAEFLLTAAYRTVFHKKKSFK